MTGASAAGGVGYSQTFSYAGDGSGAYGNVSCSPSAPGCVSFGYNAGTNQINGYSYDAAGDVASDGSNTYQWDAEAHLVGASNGSGTVSIDTYNALGERVEDITPTSTAAEAYGAGGNLLLHCNTVTSCFFNELFEETPHPASSLSHSFAPLRACPERCEGTGFLPSEKEKDFPRALSRRK